MCTALAKQTCVKQVLCPVAFSERDIWQLHACTTFALQDPLFARAASGRAACRKRAAWLDEAINLHAPRLIYHDASSTNSPSIFTMLGGQCRLLSSHFFCL
jgi:hypothetical protein